MEIFVSACARALDLNQSAMPIDLHQTRRPCRVALTFQMEGHMATNEFYYLVMVLGAFGTFAVAVAAARLEYTAWRRQAGRATARQPVANDVAKPAFARAA